MVTRRAAASRLPIEQLAARSLLETDSCSSRATLPAMPRRRSLFSTIQEPHHGARAVENLLQRYFRFVTQHRWPSLCGVVARSPPGVPPSTNDSLWHSTMPTTVKFSAVRPESQMPTLDRHGFNKILPWVKPMILYPRNDLDAYSENFLHMML